ncbi:hypothetical protein MOD76_19775 [Bacillus spizizenii]|nr:hypothetical protein [Bacillus spizizenii]MCY8902909.1 hypothetical protein [Bacillus spizizenii]MCY8907066.1 hypothetical protein [Bacillus spizizenii]
MSHLFNTFHTKKINVFFDESGKGIKQRPNLLGSLSIPKKIYECDDIQYMNWFLRKKTFHIHWKNYNGGRMDKANIQNLIELFITYKDLIKLNIINYHYGFLSSQPLFEQKDVEATIYSKLPERLIYGLIRGYGSEATVSADIYIEAASEYERIKLNETLVTDLNSQSLYRGEKFITTSCEMLPKNTEVGLELTDVLLGLIRTIIQNPDIEGAGRSTKEKVNFTVELLQDKGLKNILSDIKYYEWRGHKQLTQINFIDYIDSFLLQHHY